ncbi:hypothetical protein CWT12_06535 [Actinomyces sp. 432]|uniref:hypothetical protein n=1 Tax=Actinomyces sp. 432 TaxID=2057798 RepID=UPI0013739702|nr:hypothetical protein [Actinomyces sp. 432]QHO91045.1 hypothetical protein CWT12_06535 [Actinomyces sp. 432]
MADIVLRELLHLAVYLGFAFTTYYVVLSLLRRDERKPQMTDRHPPEPTNTGPAYTVGKILGALILTGLSAVLLSALAALVIVIWRAVL